VDRDAVGVAFFVRIAIGDRPMRHNPFESQLERLARTLTDRYGVRVVCQGEGAYTDGKRIVLPSLPEPMSAPLERMVVGFLDHEMSHVAFSDFKVVGAFATQHPGYFGLLNAVEDAFIEQRAMRRWPGVRANLDAMFRQIRGRVREKLRQADPFHRFSCAVYFKLSHHRDMLGTDDEIIGFEDLLDDFASVKNTRDVATLSERILDRWLARQAAAQQSVSNENGPPSPEGEPTRSNGKPDRRASTQKQDEAAGSNDGKSGTAETDTDSLSPGESSVGSKHPSTDVQSSESGTEGNATPQTPEGPDNSAPNPRSGDPTTGQASSGPNCPAASHQDTDGNEGDGDQRAATGNGAGGHGGTLITEALGEAIAEQAAQVNGSQEYRVFTTAHDRIDVVATASLRDVQALLARGADTTRRLRRSLVNALRSAEKRWWREDQSRGALSPRTLHRLCIDQPRLDVFRTKSTVQGRSTSVCLVLDASGSMTTRKMDVARDAVHVLIHALTSLNVATEAFAFTTGDEFDINRACVVSNLDVPELRQRFGRLSNLKINLIKTYGEPVKVALRRLPSIRGTGLTPLGEAILIGAKTYLRPPRNPKDHARGDRRQSRMRRPRRRSPPPRVPCRRTGFRDRHRTHRGWHHG
jgi:cobalamin biosynthesis protein CobT